MWYKSESNVMPELVDKTSSQKYVYVRKDVKKETVDENEVYVYSEQKIPKEDWELYEQINEDKNDITDIRDALVELAEMVAR